MTPEEIVESATHGSTETALKRSFETSRFATTRPRYTEQPFVVALDGGFLVRGRIDAVYVDGDRWELVDYKTGREPDADDATAKMQLAIYALAARKIWGIPPERLTVTYFYLKTGNAVSTSGVDLGLTEDDLVAMFHKIEAGEFEPVPTPICHYCDFLRFCDAGKAYVAAEEQASG
jgi:RecB family exonuclease